MRCKSILLGLILTIVGFGVWMGIVQNNELIPRTLMSITQSQTEFGQFYATTGRSVTLVVLAHRMGDRVFDQKIERIMKKYYDRYYIFVVLSFVSIIIVLCIMIGLIGPPKR